MKIFLSHNSRDKALVREIRSHFPNHVKIWLDEDELLVGQELKVSIKSAIEEDADFVVIFLGKEAVQSEWVKKELSWALEREKKINRVFVLPVLLDDVWELVEPVKFRDRLYLKCFDQSAEGIKNLSKKLSDQIFAWLSRHLDTSKREELKKKKDADNTHKALKAMTKMTEAFSKDVPDSWAKDLRNICISLKQFSPEIQIERLSSKVSKELEKWKEADKRTKESLEKDEIDEPLSKLGLTMTTIANGKMIELLENCNEEIEMWMKHKNEIKADIVLKRIYALLNIE